MSKRRPYVYEDREWPEIAGIQEKVDIQGDEVPLSEFDQPYLFGDDEDDTYPTYETDYPDLPRYPFPDPDPVPIPGPCDAEDGCGFVNFVDFPETLECDEEYWFRTVHEVHGCQPANFEDAFLVWSVSAGTMLNRVPGEASIEVGMRYRAPSCCDADEVNIRVESIDGSCVQQRTFKLECEDCCDIFTLTGPNTINPGTTWVGTISPPCTVQTVTANGVGNSGCSYTFPATVAGDGASVSVAVPANVCGSFVVTVNAAINIDCSNPQTANIGVRINNVGFGGAWVYGGVTQFGTCPGIGLCFCGPLEIRAVNGPALFANASWEARVQRECTTSSPPRCPNPSDRCVIVGGVPGDQGVYCPNHGCPGCCTDIVSPCYTVETCDVAIVRLVLYFTWRCSPCPG